MKSSHNLHSVWSYGHPLGKCRGCGHRALSLAAKIDDLRGNMRELRALRSTCPSCGSRDWSGWPFVNATERDAWPEGLVVFPQFPPPPAGTPIF